MFTSESPQHVSWCLQTGQKSSCIKKYQCEAIAPPLPCRQASQWALQTRLFVSEKCQRCCMLVPKDENPPRCPVYPSTSTSRFSTWWYQFISVTNRNILIKTTVCTCRPGSGALQWHCFYHGCSRTQLCGVMCLLLRSKHNLRGWNLVSLHCNLLQSVLMKCFNTCSDSCTSTKRIYLNKTLFFSERICLFVSFCNILVSNLCHLF